MCVHPHPYRGLWADLLVPQLTSATQEDLDTGPNSTAAQTRFKTRIPPSQQPHPHRSQHPSSKGVLADQSHKDHPRNISPDHDRPLSRKGKTVIFTAPTYYEHSANGESGEEGEEGEDDEMMGGEQVFEDEIDEESDFSDDGMDEEGLEGENSRGKHVRRTSGGNDVRQDDLGDDGGDEEELSEAQWEEERVRSVQAQAEAQWRAQQGQHRPLSPSQQQSLHLQQQQHGTRRALSPTQSQDTSIEQRALSPSQNQLQLQHQQQQLIQQQHQQRTMGGQYTAPLANDTQNLQRQSSDPYAPRRADAPRTLRTLPELDDDQFDQDAPTKKLSATPPIVRDHSFDINNPYGDLPGGVRSPSPIRVRGVEVVDPKDPRYGKLITERRPDQFTPTPRRPSDGSQENFAPGASTDTVSSFISGSDDSQRAANAAPSMSVLTKKGSRDSVDGGEKKKKTGGILSGLFRKKDKKKKVEKDEVVEGRSSEENSRLSTSNLQRSSSLDEANRIGAGRRESQTVDSMFSTESALRQQQVEAKQAIYHQYGVQRAPGDRTNTMTPRANLQSLNSSLTPSTLPGTPQRMRPGSLVGSPSIPGLDVPLLSVLRVFAGENIESEATFKTVLLNRLTSTTDLVKQSMQRFRLDGSEEQEEYYLTVRELGGEERPLAEEEKPLVTFESLSDSPDGSGLAVPSVKRSSVGSISSITSNLSLNPAITRLGMNDFSDDSAVKFYLNRKARQPTAATTAPPMENSFSGTSATLEPFSPTPSFRFAIRLLIHPADLPENVVFDPSSSALIPKSVYLERQQRSGVDSTEPLSSEPRERIVFFPKNASVSEVVEAALDRFGIVDGIVDGGDEVEDRVSRRRSISRVKYGLAVELDGKGAYHLSVASVPHTNVSVAAETLLGSSSKVLDAYKSAPLFKAYDRTSKEFRRRSVDATIILGAPEDVQDSDPVFIIRRAAPHTTNTGTIARGAVDELAAHRQQQAHLRSEPTSTLLAPPTRRSDTSDSFNAPSVYATPMEEISAPFDTVFAPSPPAPVHSPTRHEFIIAQRAATRANQLAIVSAQKNAEQGVDIVLPDRSTVRSSRNFADGGISYSYIDQDGDATDISEIVEKEWTAPAAAAEAPAGVPRSSEDNSTIGGGSFLTALSSPTSEGALRSPERLDAAGEVDDRAAIDALRSTPLSVEATRPQPTSSGSSDVLEPALRFNTTTPSSPTTQETLQERLDRVLARVKDDKSRRMSGARSPDSRPTSRARAAIAGIVPTSGRASPANEQNGSQARSGGRRSPYADGRNSPSIEQLINTPKTTTPLARSLQHGQQSSLSSNLSSVTAVSPTTRSASGGKAMPRPPIIYREDFGLETLMILVDDGSRTRTVKPKRDLTMDSLFGHSLDHRELAPGVSGWYVEHSKKFDDLDSVRLSFSPFVPELTTIVISDSMRCSSR